LLPPLLLALLASEFEEEDDEEAKSRPKKLGSGEGRGRLMGDKRLMPLVGSDLDKNIFKPPSL
jgi:hypothetical protein